MIMRENERLRLLATASSTPLGAAPLLADGPAHTRNSTSGSARVFGSGRGAAAGRAALVLLAGAAGYQVGLVLAVVMIAFALDALYLQAGRASRSAARRAVLEHLVVFVDGVAGALAQRTSLETAIAGSVELMPPGELRRGLERLRTFVKQGLPLDEALTRFDASMSNEDVSATVAVLLSYLRVGSKALDGFGRFSRRLRTQHELLDTVQARLLILHRIIGAAAAAVVALAILVRSWIAPWMFERPSGGTLLLEFGVALVLGAVVVSRRLIRL